MAKLMFIFTMLFCLAPAHAWDASAFKKPTREEIKQRLTPLQYKVTQEEGTEPSVKNEYNANKTPGIYVDIVSGEPLFSSLDKYESGTGWPSFTKPLVDANIRTKEDRTLFLGTRTEVRSRYADSHLGHVFDDGPAPTGKRYCMNSAAMRFIPAENLQKEGYGEFAKLFAGISQAAAAAPESQGTATNGTQTALLAGGCFWCMEPPFEKAEGVISAVSGYTGGKIEKPTYEQVSEGGTGHVEAVQVTFDPKKISYNQILDIFWRQIDPTDAGGQFVDRGQQYRSAIFYQDETQKKAAVESRAKLQASNRFDKPLVTEIVKAGPFYPAEDYHQDYYKKNPLRYKFYRAGSGRDRFLDRVWKDEIKAPK